MNDDTHDATSGIETAHDSLEEYRDHYVGVEVTAKAAPPHAVLDDDVTVAVRVYDGPPKGTLDHILTKVGRVGDDSDASGDVVAEWTRSVPAGADSVTPGHFTDLLERARDHIDQRVEQSTAVTAAVSDALGDVFGDDDPAGASIDVE